MSQLFHSASSETKMGVVNKYIRWAWLMTSLDSLRVRILSELTFETRYNMNGE